MNIRNIIVAACVISVGLSNSTAMAVLISKEGFQTIALLASIPIGVSAIVGAALGAKKGSELEWMSPAGGAAAGIIAGGIAGAVFATMVEISGLMAYGAKNRKDAIARTEREEVRRKFGFTEAKVVRYLKMRKKFGFTDAEVLRYLQEHPGADLDFEALIKICAHLNDLKR